MMSRFGWYVSAWPSGANGFIDCRSMALGQKRVDLVAVGPEREGVGPPLRCDTCELLHRLGVEYVDDARVADGDIEALVYAIKAHYVWRATQGVLTQDFSAMGIEGDQHPGIASAEQPMGVEIEIEPMRASRRDGECALDTFGLSRVDHDDLRGVSDVHIEYLRL